MVVDEEFIRQSGLDRTTVVKSFQFLLNELGPARFGILLSYARKNYGHFLLILSLSKNLSTLNAVDGYEELIDKLKKEKNFDSFVFEAEIAAKIREKVFDVVLEPLSNQKGPSPDLKFSIDNEDIYVECKSKTPSSNRSSAYNFHNLLWEKLKKKDICDGTQIDLYVRDITIPSLKDTTKFVNSHVSDSHSQVLTEDETLYLNIKKGSGVFSTGSLYSNVVNLPSTYFDMLSGTYVAQSLFLGRFSFSVIGPYIDESAGVVEAIKTARKQLPKSKPSIVVINSSLVLGKVDEIKKNIRRLFQPKKNTRLSAVVVYKSLGDFQGKSHTVESFVEINHFAKNKLSAEAISDLLLS